QRPVSAQTFSSQLESQMAVAQPGVRIANRRPRAPIPDVDVARAVFARRNVAFEVGVVDRMILDLDGEPPIAHALAGTLGNRPAFEHAVQLETKVEVQPSRFVSLDHELQLVA